LASKRPAFSENIHRLFDEAKATDLAPGIVSLIESRATHAQIREVPTNRIRLAEAPPEIRELVSLRKDTLSHAYELMKVRDERLRRRLAKKVAAGELTLSRLRVLTGGSPPPKVDADAKPKRRAKTVAGHLAAARDTDDALVNNRARLAGAVDELVDLLSRRELIDEIPDTNRDNLARYLTVTKLKLENAIAIIRATREAAP